MLLTEHISLRTNAGQFNGTTMTYDGMKYVMSCHMTSDVMTNNAMKYNDMTYDVAPIARLVM